MQISKPFLNAVQQSDQMIDPAYCALLISQAIQPGLDISPSLEILRTMAEKVQIAGVESGAQLVDFFTENYQFRGNPEEYYTVENSLLDKVLTTRLGIPISLALIYICVGNPQLPIYGINFPGHFLVGVKNSRSDSVTLIDPFDPCVVTHSQCYHLMEKLYQRKVAPDDSHFSPAENRVLLLRLLENIKRIYLQQGETDPALTCLDHQLMISPGEQNLLSQQKTLLSHMQKTGINTPPVH